MRQRRNLGEIRLTPAVLEVLTVIAYRQPITRAEIEALRGASASDPIQQLVEKGLVRVAGRHDSLGRPAIYATTKKFLELAGINSPADLPAI